MTASAYGFGWPNVNPPQQTPWGSSPFSSQGVPQQLQQLQYLTSLQSQQIQQLQQLLLLIPQQFQQAVQQIAYVVSHQLQQLQQHPPTPQPQGSGSPFQTLPFGQPFFAGQPGQVM